MQDSRYQVAANKPPHHLHGGASRSFDKVHWTVADSDTDTLTLTYVSPTGQEGYPGRVEAEAIYRVTGDTLRVTYRATTDAPSPVNMTNHSYFNLSGAGSGSVLEHELAIFADHFTQGDEDLIPTGEVVEVAGTALDLRSPVPISASKRFEDGTASRVEIPSVEGPEGFQAVLDEAQRPAPSTPRGTCMV
ncbi:hypothetical protein ER308_01360 [Egibacter rhizosphaerae]|uniref:Aldose 1-epimerase n=1 Tax=Egibacter rhizosphaerae TaxID=1670831 RepID=A0A411YAV5_9ACTN|nr:hypothetical protein [Egibacter rhizosphaerae]QBI18350.1 hypothetical protein ER308_01360 [Egibacter rhizosphaerae]